MSKKKEYITPLITVITIDNSISLHMQSHGHGHGHGHDKPPKPPKPKGPFDNPFENNNFK